MLAGRVENDGVLRSGSRLKIAGHTAVVVASEGRIGVVGFEWPPGGNQNQASAQYCRHSGTRPAYPRATFAGASPENAEG